MHEVLGSTLRSRGLGKKEMRSSYVVLKMQAGLTLTVYVHCLIIADSRVDKETDSGGFRKLFMVACY